MIFDCVDALLAINNYKWICHVAFTVNSVIIYTFILMLHIILYAYSNMHLLKQLPIKNK